MNQSEGAAHFTKTTTMAVLMKLLGSASFASKIVFYFICQCLILFDSLTGECTMTSCSHLKNLVDFGDHMYKHLLTTNWQYVNIHGLVMIGSKTCLSNCSPITVFTAYKISFSNISNRI